MHLNQRIRLKNSLCLFQDNHEYAKKLKKVNKTQDLQHNTTADKSTLNILHEEIYKPNQFQMQNVIIEIAR